MSAIPVRHIETDALYSQFDAPELEERISKIVAKTTRLVRDDAGKDDLRQAFAKLAELKSRRNPIDIYRIECLLNLGDLR